jgi:hypothetical protein
MRRNLVTILSVAVLALGLAAGARGTSQHTAAGSGDPASLAEPVVEVASLAELRASPADRLGRTVSFVVQHKGLVETWNPYLTRFGPTDWLGVEGWADERFTWEREVWDDPAPRLFVRRGTVEALLLRELLELERYRVTAVVREVFLAEPWIEILTVDPLYERVPEGSILHVSRARLLQAQGQWELALQQYHRGHAGPLPNHARAEIERLIAECEAARDRATKGDDDEE